MSPLIRIYTVCHSKFDFWLIPLFETMDMSKVQWRKNPLHKPWGEKFKENIDKYDKACWSTEAFIRKTLCYLNLDNCSIGNVFVLRFYGAVNSMRSYRARSVYHITLLLGRLNPLCGWPVLCIFFRQKLTSALLESAEERRKHFVIKSPRKNVADLAGVEPATSWSPVGRESNSHRDRLQHW